MRNRAVIIFLCAGLSLFTDAKASHIVGGEIELIHQSGTQYKLNLNLYFDVINGSPGAEENAILVSIFRKKDNQRMGSVQLPRI